MTIETVKASDLPKVEEDQGLLLYLFDPKQRIINRPFSDAQMVPHSGVRWFFDSSVQITF